MKKSIPVGIALSDHAADDYMVHRIIGDTLPKVHLDAVEIQLTDVSKFTPFLAPGVDIGDFFTEKFLKGSHSSIADALGIVRKSAFKSVHGPMYLGNLSSLDDKLRGLAVESTKERMAIADAFDANLLVLHPCQFGWDEWKKYEGVKDYTSFRRLSVDYFLKSLSELSCHYYFNGFTFDLGLENLEFNQFPSTLGEMSYLLNSARDVWRVKNPVSRVGLVVDVMHLAHSKIILEEKVGGGELGMSHDALVRYAGVPICKPFDYVAKNGEVVPVFNRLFSEHCKDILLVHLSGNDSLHATHDPILYDIGEFVYGGKEYAAGMLNMREVLDIIGHSDYSNPIVMEVISNKVLPGDRFEDMVQSRDNVQKYLDSIRK